MQPEERGAELLRPIPMIVALVLAVAGLAALAGTSGLEASGHSAVRSFAQSWAPPGGRLVVTITATNYGGFGQVEETLPAGFSYAGTSLGDSSVTLDGRTVSFVLLGDRSFTYTVEVPGAEGRYTFTGVFSDSDREDQAVGGASQVRVGPQPTATPIPTPTPTTEPTATPSPTPAPTTTPTTEPTATPPSTPTPTQEPTATPTPEPAATATPLPTLAPTDVPAPTQIATQEPSAGPTPETETAAEGSGGLGVLGAAVAGVLLLAAGFLAGYWAGRRKTP